MSEPAFSLGRVVATPGVLASVDPALCYACLARHRVCDWGDLDACDKGTNDAALITAAVPGALGWRLFSSYRTPSGALYIITEPVDTEHRTTTLLLADEY